MKLYLQVKYFLVCDSLKTVWKFYRYPKFAWIDLRLQLLYLFYNPYRVSRKFLQKKGEADVYTYGETPLVTLQTICQKAQIEPGKKIMELGCGRGRTVFWLAHVYGCPTRGIEWVPLFVRIARLFRSQDAQFLCQNFLDTDLSQADVLYLYLSALDDASIAQIAAKIAPGTKIISVSYSLADYSPRIRPLTSFLAPFPWGEGEVFVSEAVE